MIAPINPRFVRINPLIPPINPLIVALNPFFMGWHGARTFDLALRGVALRLTLTDAGWSVATPDKAQPTAIGFACRQATGPGGTR